MKNERKLVTISNQKSGVENSADPITGQLRKNIPACKSITLPDKL